MNHFTNKTGYDAIRSQVKWLFAASQPPGEHPRGAYFTTLGPDEPKLANKLRIPRDKLMFLFSFAGQERLRPLPGGRGAYIYYSHYEVVPDRQTFSGPTEPT